MTTIMVTIEGRSLANRIRHAFFAPVTLTLTRWPWHMNLTRRFWRHTLGTKVNFPGQGFQKLEHHKQTDRQTHRQTRPNTLPRRIRQ